MAQQCRNTYKVQMKRNEVIGKVDLIILLLQCVDVLCVALRTERHLVKEKILTFGKMASWPTRNAKNFTAHCQIHQSIKSCHELLEQSVPVHHDTHVVLVLQIF
jgi:hypothetical protein